LPNTSVEPPAFARIAAAAAETGVMPLLVLFEKKYSPAFQSDPFGMLVKPIRFATLVEMFVDVVVTPSLVLVQLVFDR